MKQSLASQKKYNQAVQSKCRLMSFVSVMLTIILVVQIFQIDENIGQVFFDISCVLTQSATTFQSEAAKLVN